MRRGNQKHPFGFVLAAVVAGAHVISSSVYADPIVPAAHDALTVWTGNDSAGLDAAGIGSLVGQPGLAVLYESRFGAATIASNGGLGDEALGRRVVFTAVEAGPAGHDITVAIVAPGAADSPLSVSVAGRAITISLATNASGAVASTAAHVAAAVNATPAAVNLVSASTGGNAGAGIVETMSQTALAPVVVESGGYAASYDTTFSNGPLVVATLASSDGHVVFTARQPGPDGQDITVAIVDPGAAHSPLSVSVVGKAITISLATDANGDAISTAAHVVAAVNADPAASTLVSASTGGDAGAVVATMSQTALVPVVTGSEDCASSDGTLFPIGPCFPPDARLEHVGGPAISADALFLYVKDADQVPAFYIYDLLALPTAWDALAPLLLSGFWAPGGSITSLQILGIPRDVPEAASVTLLVLGFGALMCGRGRRATARIAEGPMASARSESLEA